MNVTSTITQRDCGGVPTRQFQVDPLPLRSAHRAVEACSFAATSR